MQQQSFGSTFVLLWWMCIVAPTFFPSRLMYSKESFFNFDSIGESSVVQESENWLLLCCRMSFIFQFSQSLRLDPKVSYCWRNPMFDILELLEVHSKWKIRRILCIPENFVLKMLFRKFQKFYSGVNNLEVSFTKMKWLF